MRRKPVIRAPDVAHALTATTDCRQIRWLKRRRRESSLAHKREIALTTAVATTMVAVFQFQRFDFASVFTTSGFSAIESDPWEFVMVNFANFDGLCGFRGLEDRTPANTRRRYPQKRPVFRVASSRFECRCFVILKTICSIFYGSVRPSVLGKTSPSPVLLNHHSNGKTRRTPPVCRSNRERVYGSPQSKHQTVTSERETRFSRRLPSNGG